MPGRSLPTTPGRGRRLHRARPRALQPRRPHPRAPTRAPTLPVCLRRPPTQTRVGSARASAAARKLLRGGRADQLPGGCFGAGRVAPLRPPEPGYLRNSALGLWGAKCNPNPVPPPEPRADKHAQARTQTSPRPALAAAGSRRQGRTEPGARRGRRLRLVAPGAAAHPHRSQGRQKSPASPAWSNGATAGLGPQPRRPGRGGSGRRTQLVGGGAGRAGSRGGTGATGLEGRTPAALSGPAARSRPSAAAAPGRSGAPRPRLPSPVLPQTSWRGGSAPGTAEIATGWAWGRCLWLNRADARKLQQVAPWRNG